MSIQVFNNILNANSPTTVSVPDWGGVVEFLNFTPWPVSIVGGSGVVNLGASQRVAVPGLPQGSNYVVTATPSAVVPGSISQNFQVNWYNINEMQPYAPTDMGVVPVTSVQTGPQSNILPIVNNNVAGGGTDNLGGFAGQTLYLYGFDISGDKSAAANTGRLSISGLVNPINQLPLSLIYYWINQGTGGTTPFSIRFPVAMQGAFTQIQGSDLVTFSYPNMSAGVTIVIWSSHY